MDLAQFHTLRHAKVEDLSRVFIGQNINKIYTLNNFEYHIKIQKLHESMYKSQK
ncbi:MAG: hypothetical protein RIQ77_320 [Pseudomonadota bacterium]